jgi:hypothetical protein
MISSGWIRLNLLGAGLAYLAPLLMILLIS